MMPTKLTKPVTRRIGDLVVSLEEAGVRVRRHHCRHSLLTRHEDLCQPMEATTRDEAFAKPLQKGWLPEIGQRVWVRRIARTKFAVLAKANVVRVIESLPECVIVVEEVWGDKLFQEQILWSDVRPL